MEQDEEEHEEAAKPGPSPGSSRRKQTVRELLERAYSVYKKEISELQKQLEESHAKCKALDRLKSVTYQKGKGYQLKNDSLEQENDRLKKEILLLKNSSQAPCEMCRLLRDNLESEREAYKITLDEKQRTISRLEQQLQGFKVEEHDISQHKSLFGRTGSYRTRTTSHNESGGSSKYEQQGAAQVIVPQLPDKHTVDMQSKVATAKEPATHGTPVAKLNRVFPVSETEDHVMRETDIEDQTVNAASKCHSLKLSKTRKRDRCRYTEETLQASKRAKTSPGSTSAGSQQSPNSASQPTLCQNITTLETPYEEEKKAVLVPETEPQSDTIPDSEEDCSQVIAPMSDKEAQEIEGKSSKHLQKLPQNAFQEDRLLSKAKSQKEQVPLVVPETVPVSSDSSDDETAIQGTPESRDVTRKLASQAKRRKQKAGVMPCKQSELEIPMHISLHTEKVCGNHKEGQTTTGNTNHDRKGEHVSSGRLQQKEATAYQESELPTSPVFGRSREKGQGRRENMEGSLSPNLFAEEDKQRDSPSRSIYRKNTGGNETACAVRKEHVDATGDSNHSEPIVLDVSKISEPSPSAITGKTVKLNLKSTRSSLRTKSNSLPESQSVHCGPTLKQRKPVFSSQSSLRLKGSEQKLHGQKSLKENLSFENDGQDVSKVGGKKKLKQTTLSQISFKPQKTPMQQLADFNSKYYALVLDDSDGDPDLQLAMKLSLEEADKITSSKVNLNTALELSTVDGQNDCNHGDSSQVQSRDQSEETSGDKIFARNLDVSDFMLEEPQMTSTPHEPRTRSQFKTNSKKDSGEMFKMPHLPKRQVTPKGKIRKTREEENCSDHKNNSKRLVHTDAERPNSTDQYRNPSELLQFDKDLKTGDKGSATQMHALNGSIDPDVRFSEYDDLDSQLAPSDSENNKARVPSQQGMEPVSFLDLDLQDLSERQSQSRSQKVKMPVDINSEGSEHIDASARSVVFGKRKGSRSGPINEELPVGHMEVPANQDEESQPIDASAKSVTFGRRVHHTKQVEQEESDLDSCPDIFASQAFGDDPEQKPVKVESTESFEDSFDRVPGKQDGPGYAHVDVVRKHADREKLDAWACKECDEYYSCLALTEDEKRQRMKTCRHKARYAPPSTPEHYWSIGFPDTQVCEERGYLNRTQAKPSKHRRKRGYRKLFKTEREERGEDQEEETEPGSDQEIDG